MFTYTKQWISTTVPVRFFVSW